MRKEGKSGGSNMLGHDDGESMSCKDDSDSTDPKQTLNPHPDTAESAGPCGWLDALNSFLERSFLKADVDTGC
jgi:hypothetical protein